MKTLSPPATIETIPSATYAAPMKREDALSEGDWECAYTLACREEGVRYLTESLPKRDARRRGNRNPS